MGRLRQEQTPSPALCWDTPLRQAHHPLASAHFQGPTPPISATCWKTQQPPGAHTWGSPGPCFLPLP